MSQWKARIAVLAVFVAGFICGGAVFHLFSLQEQNRILHSRDLLAQMVLHKLDQDLELSDQQKEAILKILLDARTDVLHLTEQIRPQIHQIFDRSQERIRTVLDEKQRAEFDAIVKQRKEWMKQIESKK